MTIRDSERDEVTSTRMGSLARGQSDKQARSRVAHRTYLASPPVPFERPRSRTAHNRWLPGDVGVDGRTTRGARCQAIRVRRGEAGWRKWEKRGGERRMPGEVSGGSPQGFSSTYMPPGWPSALHPGTSHAIRYQDCKPRYLKREIAGRSSRGHKCAVQPADDTDDNGNGCHTRAHKTRHILRCDAKKFNHVAK